MRATATLTLTWALVATSCAPNGSEAEAAEARVDFSRVTDTLEAVDAPGIEKVHSVSGVFLAGQPDESGFDAAKKGGIATVIDLRHDGEIELDERALVEKLGMTYLHLPWNGAEELTDEVFDRAREMLKSAEKPILLHCKSANRVGAVWLPHRVLDGGLSVDDAVTEAKAVGLKATEYEQKARDYIERKSR